MCPAWSLNTNSISGFNGNKKIIYFSTANVESNEKLPVLFFIHGGGYAEGHGNENLYGPDFIMERQTILVTINYRLGILGFLSLDSPLYSGNMGLKDQLLALKWIHANIEHFNGDKNKITIFGQSAGMIAFCFTFLCVFIFNEI